MALSGCEQLSKQALPAPRTAWSMRALTQDSLVYFIASSTFQLHPEPAMACKNRNTLSEDIQGRKPKFLQVEHPGCTS